MSRQSFFRTSAYLTAGGVLFAGYITGVKYLTQTCAFNEPCPLFLGYPACWFGLGLFLSLFIASGVGLVGKGEGKGALRFITVVSGLGILFAGQFVIPEIMNWVRRGNPNYLLILPTCAYGLIFYTIVFILSLKRALRGK